MMNKLLEKIDEITGLTGGAEAKASVTAEYPAMFLYFGEKAAESCPVIRKQLREKLMNSRSILHGGVTANDTGDIPDTDFTLRCTVPAERGNALDILTGSDELLERFNDCVKTAVDKLMKCSGFPQTNRCFLFIVSDTDSPLNALLPEFVMLFSENAHIRVSTYLFAQLSGAADGFVSSAAFFKELEDCRKPDFTYDRAVMYREGQHIPVHWEGALFDGVFFLEMYRSDMKYSPRNAENNARIAAMTAVLTDKAEPVALPGSMFLTAGISSAGKPSAAISHILYKSIIDLLVSENPEDIPQIPVSKLFGYDVIYSESERVTLTLPEISDIVSAMPKKSGSDPDSVKNTNICNILEYYGGADEEYFELKYAEPLMRMIGCCEGADIQGIFADYIDKGTLRLSGAIRYLEHDGAVSQCLNEVADRLNAEEEALNTQLSELLEQPCPELPHGLFSKPTGCDILAAAVKAKYSLKLEIIKLQAAKRLASDMLGRVSRLEAAMSTAAGKIKALSDELTEDILRELYDDESTLTDAEAFTGHYAGTVRGLPSVTDAAARAGSLYDTLMECGTKGTDGLTDTAAEIYRRLTAEPSVREIFAESFDKELYDRYKDFGGGKDPGWVDARLIDRLRDTCRANLRYSVFQPVNSLFCMGNREIGFVRRMLDYEDPGFTTVHVGDVKSDTYEQLAVYGVPSIDSMVYANECMKVYEKTVAESGDNVYIKR